MIPNPTTMNDLSLMAPPQAPREKILPTLPGTCATGPPWANSGGSFYSGFSYPSSSYSGKSSYSGSSYSKSSHSKPSYSQVELLPAELLQVELLQLELQQLEFLAYLQFGLGLLRSWPGLKPWINPRTCNAPWSRGLAVKVQSTTS